MNNPVLTQDSSALTASVNDIPTYRSSCKSSVIYKLTLCNSMTALLGHIHFQKSTLLCCVPNCSYNVVVVIHTVVCFCICSCSNFIKLFYYALYMLMFKDSCLLGCNPVSLGVWFTASWRTCPSAPYKQPTQQHSNMPSLPWRCRSSAIAMWIFIGMVMFFVCVT